MNISISNNIYFSILLKIFLKEYIFFNNNLYKYIIFMVSQNTTNIEDTQNDGNIYTSRNDKKFLKSINR